MVAIDRSQEALGPVSVYGAFEEFFRGRDPYFGLLYLIGGGENKPYGTCRTPFPLFKKKGEVFILFQFFRARVGVLFQSSIFKIWLMASAAA